MDLRDRTATGVAANVGHVAEPSSSHGEESADTITILKVSTRSRPSAVAGAIAGVLRQDDHVELQVIGAGATNQAVKAIAIARAYLADDDIDLCFRPSFIDLVIADTERTALRLQVERCAA